jgi:hypothetical protein
MATTEPDAVQVECFSGHTYAQEPRLLIWQGRRYPILRVEERWRTPDGPAFCVRADSGDRFELAYREVQDRWLLRVLPAVAGQGTGPSKILTFPARPLHPESSETMDKEVQN